MLEQPWRELFAIIRQQLSRRAIGNNTMSGKCFGHDFGGDLPMRDCSDEFREAIQDDQLVLIFAWCRNKLATNIDGHKLHESKRREKPY